MDSENNGLPYQNSNIRKDGSLGIVFFIPIFILILLFLVVPMVITFFRSFTNYNIIKSELIMFKNYGNILKDEVTKIKIVNTLIAFLFAVPLTVATSLLFAWLSSKINRIFRYIIAVLLLIASITSVTPDGLIHLMSSIGVEFYPFMNSPILSRMFLILIPLLLGIGPLYLLFTIGYLMKERISSGYLHIAVSLQLILCVLSFFTTKSAGFPSYSYYADNLLSAIYDYSFIRFELGYSGALAVLLVVLLVIFMAIYNGIVWLIGKLPGTSNSIRQGTPEPNPAAQSQQTVCNPTVGLLIFLALLVVSIVMLLPFIQLVFKTDVGSYENVLFSEGSFFGTALRNSILTFLTSTIVLAVVSVLSGMGTAQAASGVKKMIIPLVIITFLLSPSAILYIGRNGSNITNLLFYAVPAAIKSLSFGLCVFISSVTAKHYADNHQPGKLLSSATAGKYLLYTLSLSLLASLASWFYPISNSRGGNIATLFQMYPYITSGNSYNTTSSAYLILTMLIPIVIIVVFTPLLLGSLHKKHDRA